MTPILIKLATWSDHHLRDIHPTLLDGGKMEYLRKDKAAFARMLESRYREKLASIPNQ